MIQTILCVLMAEIWNTSGQLLFKKSADALLFAPEEGRGTYGIFFKEVFRQPGILLGLFCHAVGLIFWLVALSQAALSVVFVLGSMQYILILIAARIFLGEKIDSMRFLGTLFIATGIALVALSGLS
jgi:drug/metabolite transporter (DMT)-like permease